MWSSLEGLKGLKDAWHGLANGALDAAKTVAFSTGKHMEDVQPERLLSVVLASKCSSVCKNK